MTLVKYILTIAMAWTSVAQAFDVTTFPNNTATFLKSQQTSDGVVTLSSAHLFHHLYGNDLVLDLYIYNLAEVKDIYIVKRGDENNTMRAVYSEDFYMSLASASWRYQTSDGRDNVAVKMSGYNYPGSVYTIYVVMNGVTYSNQIEIGK